MKSLPKKLQKLPKRSSRFIVAMNLRILRAAHGYTQEDLAEHAGLDRSFIADIERGDLGVNLDTLDRLAQAFALKPWDLLHPRDAGGR